MNVTKPRPSDHPTLLIFIVGGTTCTELRQINEALSVYQENNIQVSQKRKTMRHHIFFVFKVLVVVYL